MREGIHIGERWIVERELPAAQGVVRLRAIDTTTGGTVELLTLAPAAARDPAARTAFLQVHRAVSEATHPALVSVIAIETDGPCPVVAREQLLPETLADVRQRVPEHAVAAAGAVLGDAILAASAATRGVLLEDDIGLLPDGRPVLAPSGRPLSAVDRAVAGADSDGGGSALKGLGRLLFRLAEGRAPPPGRPPTGQGPLLDAVGQLRDPRVRVSAAAIPVLSRLGSGQPDLRPYLLTVPRGPTRADREPSRGVAIIIKADALRALEPAGKSAAAGWAGVDLDALAHLVSQDAPLVVARRPSARAARRDLASLIVQTGLPLSIERSGSGVRKLGGAAAVACGGVATALAGASALLGASSLAIALLAVAALFIVGGGLALWSPRRTGLVSAARDEPDDTFALRERIASLRRLLASADLADVVSTDLRSALREVERRVDELSVGLQDTEAALEHARGAPSDAARASQRGLRARLSEIDQTLDGVADTLASSTGHALLTSESDVPRGAGDR